MMINTQIKGIYFHIPFCQDICYYCDFCKLYYDERLVDKYLNQLAKEYQSYKIDKSKIESIYIGGGSPSILSLAQLECLFSIIEPTKFTNLQEFTFEANPNQLNEKKIKILKNNGVNRVSLGVQTFNQEILRSLNRNHTTSDVENALFLLRKNQITNINIDLMYGFKQQSLADITYDLKMIEKHKISHVSLYSLILEPGTVFFNSNYQINEKEVEFGEYIAKYLVNNLGFEHYEVSNFASYNLYSTHNLLYWHNEGYYGVGLGAAGYVTNYRYYNTKSITNYLKGKYNRKYEYYNSLAELLADEIMLQFRIFNGINLKEINEKYSFDFTKYFENVIITNGDKLIIKDNVLYFTKQGQLFLNDVIIDFQNAIGK